MPAISDASYVECHRIVDCVLGQSKQGDISSDEAVNLLVAFITNAAPEFFASSSQVIKAHVQRLHDIYMAGLLDLDDACEDIDAIVDAALRNGEGLAWLKQSSI